MSTIATSDGVNLRYTDDGGAPPVVLIAGLTASAETGEPQRKAPAGRRRPSALLRPALARQLGHPGIRSAHGAARHGRPRLPATIGQSDLVNEALVKFLAGLS
jgi:hypothetical protein